MGTRNLTCVMVGGKYKIAQYGQWDGYPSGQGLTALKFLRDKMKRDVFLKNLKLAKKITKKQMDALYVECGAKAGSEWVGMDVSDRFKARNPQLSRDMGADILDFIQNATGRFFIQNTIDFAGDSLFCEWCYVVDFDKDTLEVFKGFNKEPLMEDERFASAKTSHDEYKQVKHLITFPFSALPTDEQFLTIDKEEDEE
jgi:hypothetical protein